MRAAAGQVDLALRGYRELVDYWERTGSWLQQWTTLRNLARLFRDLGDHESAWSLQTAANQAPDAPAVNETVRSVDPSDSADPPGPHMRIESEVVTRQHILDVARQAIDSTWRTPQLWAQLS